MQAAIPDQRFQATVPALSARPAPEPAALDGIATQGGPHQSGLFNGARNALLAIALVLSGCAEDTNTALTTPSPTVPPTAGFSARCQRLTCTFVNSSTDPDGTIRSHAWEFGDDETSTQEDAVHTYAAGGQFMVALTVTDDDGEETTATEQVTVRDAAPVADFTMSCNGLTCGFTDQSTEPGDGGSVVSHAWDFGDGQTATVPSPFHTYALPGGQFTVTLVVSDNRGASATIAKPVNVALAPAPDRTGTYERETPHGLTGRDSRFVIRADGTFELQDDTGPVSTIYAGRWTFGPHWGGWDLEPARWVVLLDFYDFEAAEFCGEAIGFPLLDGHMAIAYCRPLIEAGLEEGVYASAPGVDTPNLPPPLTGEIAFVRNGQIHRVNSDGSGLVQLTTGSDDQTPAWSPDGSRIAFARGGAGSGIFIMDGDGSNLVQLTGSGREPTWSPDGMWIAFTCLSAVGEQNICMQQVDDEAATPVFITQNAGQAFAPAWAPDGNSIAFTADWAMSDFWFDIWVVAPDGSGRAALRFHTPLTPNPIRQYQAAWSPDGRQIAYIECPWAWYACSSSAIGLMNADGTGAVRLVAATGFARPSWSPDGQVIVFGSGDAVEWVSADGSQRGIIIGNGYSPAWRP